MTRADSRSWLRALFLLFAAVHCAIGLFALIAPRLFYHSVPPWPPLHVGQIQIAAVFDLAFAALYFGASRDVSRFGSLAIAVGVIGEWGHAAVRIGHIALGDDPKADLFLPVCMVVAGAALLALGRRTKLI